MSISSRVVVDVTTEPVTLSDMLDYLRVDSGDDDTQITEAITQGRKYFEHVTGRAMATQQILAQFIIDRPHGGVLSGPVDDAQENFYHYEQQLGANPFGISQFFFELPHAPLQSVQSVGTQFTVFNVDGSGNPLFTTVNQLMPDGINANWVIDTTREPGRIYFQAPLIVYRWQFAYTAGYASGYPVPPDMLATLKALIAFRYDHREGDPLPDGIMHEMIGHRIDGGVWGGV